MRKTEQEFLIALQQRAKKQAKLEQSSPLPQWIRPLVSVIALHYWVFLLLLSALFAVPMSILLFRSVYSRITGGA